MPGTPSPTRTTPIRRAATTANGLTRRSRKKATPRSLQPTCSGKTPLSNYNSQIITGAPRFFQNAQNLDLRCVLLSDPSTFGAGGKTRLASRIKKFKSPFILQDARPANTRDQERPVTILTHHNIITSYHHNEVYTSFKMARQHNRDLRCVAHPSLPRGCWESKPKYGSNPGSVSLTPILFMLLLPQASRSTR